MTQFDITMRNELMKLVKETEPKDCDKNSEEYKTMLAVENYIFSTLDLLVISPPSKNFMKDIMNTLLSLGCDLIAKYPNENVCIIVCLRFMKAIIEAFEEFIKMWYDLLASKMCNNSTQYTQICTTNTTANEKI